jgi:ABC-type transport system involved in multi-copper enzyme maturation permease subunit
MAMGSDFVLVFLIAGLLWLIAGASVLALGAGLFWYWRTKSRWSLIPIALAVIYLLFFGSLFLSKLLPNRTVKIDLRHPTDLSGIPADTRWLAEQSPGPKKIVPLSIPGALCCIEGKVDLHLTLPSGETIHDQVRNIFIDVDDRGVWKINYNVYSISPQLARERIIPYLLQIAAARPTDDSVAIVKEMDERLLNYKPDAPLGVHLDLRPPPYTFWFNIRPTFLPSKNVSYLCEIELDHVPWYKRNPELINELCSPAYAIQPVNAKAKN